MLLVGLTGGIGSGKSTVAAMLAGRGAVILDADEFARRALDRETPGYARVVEEFGPAVVAPDGSIDRAALAQTVFSDPDVRLRLEAIVHPEVARLFQEASEPYRHTDRVVVYVVPLLVEEGLTSMFDVVVAVTASEEVRIRRSVARGMIEDDARARMAAQFPDADRTEAADVVLENDGSLSDLERQVEVLWRSLAGRTTTGTIGS
jgi:dephospho-CoA kinase